MTVAPASGSVAGAASVHGQAPPSAQHSSPPQLPCSSCLSTDATIPVVEPQPKDAPSADDCYSIAPVAQSSGNIAGQDQPDNDADSDGDLQQQQQQQQFSNISIFLRVRPSPRASARLMLDGADGSAEFHIPRDAIAGLINNSREHYRFQFNGVLLPEAKQDEVFERTARPLVTAALEGFNATLFAYGQTGSGKTFTITGGAERYVDRGIIPRALAALFSALEQRRGDGFEYSVSISYLEIYNEAGYDLLDPAREVARLEDMPQVFVQEDEEGRLHLRNLSSHRAATEEEALNLLFLGDTNRTISETPMNQASSRSHCVFAIDLEARRPGSDRVRRSRLSLVDLAGSERVGKTGSVGAVLKEARYINLSLHYLEQVIVALQERSVGISRAHVPYRNCLMTMVLRDSLGGNCRTVMVATVNPEQEQRVAMVANAPHINEESDPAAVIQRLKQEIRDLKDEIRLLRGGGPERGPLTPDEITRLEDRVTAFCAAASDAAPGDDDSSATPEAVALAGLTAGGDLQAIRACFGIFKRLLLAAGGVGAAGGRNGSNDPPPPAAAEESHGGNMDSQTIKSVVATSKAAAPSSSPKGGVGAATSAEATREVAVLQGQVRKLQLQVQQRDGEIASLLEMLRQEQAEQPRWGAAAAAAAVNASPAAAGGNPGDASNSSGGSTIPRNSAIGSDKAAVSGSGATQGGVLTALLDVSLLSDRNRAFDCFRQSYAHNEAIEENKQLLRAKYDEAKALGAAISTSKGRITELRSAMEHRRLQRSAACVAAGTDPAKALAQPDAQEEQCRTRIEEERASYLSAFDRLRQLKAEIIHLQSLLEGSRQRLQRDFQAWLEAMARQQQQQQQQQQLPSLKEGAAEEVVQAGAETGLQPQVPVEPSFLKASFAARGAEPTPLPPTGQHCVTTYNRRSSEATEPRAYRPNSARLGTRHVSAAPAAVEQTVLEAAKPHLTGNPVADADILRFYEARERLLRKLGAAVGGDL